MVGKGRKDGGYGGLRIFVKDRVLFRFWRYFGRIAVIPLVWLFRPRAKDAKDVDSALELIFSFRFLGMALAPAQMRGEISKLLHIVEAQKPEVVLEIGTFGGGTLFLFMRAAGPNATLVSVDLPGGAFGGGYPDWMTKLFDSYPLSGQRVHLVEGDSHDPGTLSKIEQMLGGKKVDFLFIDGDHTYEGVRKDFEFYSPLVRKGGIVAFHDVCPGPEQDVGRVPDFWLEISKRYRSESFINDTGQGGMGIGVLYL